MKQTYYPPIFGGTAFNCPNCGVYTDQFWREVTYTPGSSVNHAFRNLDSARVEALAKHIDNEYAYTHVVAYARCRHCSSFSIWKRQTMIYPFNSTVEMPNPDMPPGIQELYIEARSIVDKSPRAAMALLRLALEKLLPIIGAKPAKIDAMIDDLISKGLNSIVRKALDSIRVIGNEAVHPGKIDLEDNYETTVAMFKTLNFIVEKTITESNEISEIYNLIPEDKRNALDVRREAVKNK